MTSAEMLDLWRHHLADGRRRSPHTVRAYGSAAGRLLRQTGAENWQAVAAIDARALRTQLALRREEGLSNSSAARELSALKAFIAFASKQLGKAEEAPLRLRGPRIKKGLPRPVTPDEATGLVSEVAAQASEAWIRARDRAVLLLLYGAGLRIAEALGLNGEVHPLRDRLLLTGKGGKQRVVPVLPIVSEAVTEYVRLCPWPLPPREPLFRGEKGGALSPGMVQRAVARARTVLGLPATATPHALRHSFASHLLSAGADLRSLQELLGHASLGSTQIYTKVDTAVLLDTYRSAHPRA